MVDAPSYKYPKSKDVGKNGKKEGTSMKLTNQNKAEIMAFLNSKQK